MTTKEKVLKPAFPRADASTKAGEQKCSWCGRPIKEDFRFGERKIGGVFLCSIACEREWSIEHESKVDRIERKDPELWKECCKKTEKLVREECEKAFTDEEYEKRIRSRIRKEVETEIKRLNAEHGEYPHDTELLGMIEGMKKVLKILDRNLYK